MLARFALITSCLALVLGACTQPTATAPASATATSMPAATDGPAGTPGATPDATTEPIPSSSLAAFDCDDLPVVESATIAIANIVDVRVGEHDGYDRVVFEFVGGTPELTLDTARPPFIADGSGLPIEVEGSSFLGIVMRGGSRQMDDGSSSYDGPTNFDPGFTTLVDLVEGGDFERQSTWYLGLASDTCPRVSILTDPPRVVIDVEH